jgi:hypothetical protein
MCAATTEEMGGIIKSLDKKAYEYTCKVEPMCSHCDSQLCRTRRFGVGDEGNFPIIGGITKLDTQPAVWFVDVGSTRLELTTTDMQYYHLFQRACIEACNHVYATMKQSVWLQELSVAMENVIVLEAAPEIGIEGQFYECLEAFLTSRMLGESKDNLLLNRPWEDEEMKRYYFKLHGLKKFLQHENVRDEKGNWLKPSKISTYIQKLGGGDCQLWIKGVNLRVWWVPTRIIQKPMSPDADPVPGVPI